MREDDMGTKPKSKRELTEEIVGKLARRHSTAVVLFHHAVAERLGLGPTDHKCLDLLRERGTITGSELAAITGLTTGAITGVVTRLEQAGYVRRESDPHDGRRQILRLALQRSPIHGVIEPLRQDVAALLENFDAGQLKAVAEFLTRTTDLIYRHTALLRGQSLYASEAESRETTNQRPPRKHEPQIQL